MIRLLQLSDIHFAKKSDSADVFTDIRDGVLQDLEELSFDKFDAILICGDVAYKGAEEEYKRAKRFIDELLNTTGCKDEQVCIVPGNHDKDGLYHDAWCRDALYAKLRNSENPDEDFTRVTDNNSLSLPLLYGPYKNYLKFASQYASVSAVGSCLAREEKLTEDMEFYWKYPLGTINGCNINLYGINSCLVSVKDDANKEYKQVLPRELCYIRRKIKNTLNISMMHHPEQHINHAAEVKSLLNDRYHLQLYGHVHVQGNKKTGSNLVVTSGALQPEEMGKNNDYSPVYNIIEIDVPADENGNNLGYAVVNLVSRVWNKNKFEHYAKESEEGVKIPFRIESNEEECCEPKNEERMASIDTKRLRINWLRIDGDTQANFIKKHNEIYKYDESKDQTVNALRFIDKVIKENKVEIFKEIIGND